MRVILERTDAPEAADLAGLGTALAVFNEEDVGPSGRRTLAVFARDGDGRIIAGLSGYSGWGWLYVQWLWVDETVRGRGLAASILAEAEAEAVARSCHGIWIDTFNPAALRVYEKAGYVPFGSLDDFPKGRTRTFLQKRI